MLKVESSMWFYWVSGGRKLHCCLCRRSRALFLTLVGKRITIFISNVHTVLTSSENITTIWKLKFWPLQRGLPQSPNGGQIWAGFYSVWNGKSGLCTAGFSQCLAQRRKQLDWVAGKTWAVYLSLRSVIEISWAALLIQTNSKTT